jgi:hypothetical protein
MTVARFHGRLRLVAAALPLVAALVCLAARPPVPGEDRFIFASPDSDARTAAMREAIALIPAGAAVTATNRLGAHLSARRWIYLFPERSRAEWAVVDTRDADSHITYRFSSWLNRGRPERPASTNPFAQLERDRAWRVVFEREDIRVYRRAS